MWRFSINVLHNIGNLMFYFQLIVQICKTNLILDYLALNTLVFNWGIMFLAASEVKRSRVGKPNPLVRSEQVPDLVPGMVNVINDFSVIYRNLGVLGSASELSVVYHPVLLVSFYINNLIYWKTKKLTIANYNSVQICITYI